MGHIWSPPLSRRRTSAVLLEAGSAPTELMDSVEALLARPDVDAVVVASPAVLHDQHIAARRGCG